MTQLILQIIIRQWDKSQISEQAGEARTALPVRYAINPLSAKSLFDGRVIIDQHGDDLLGNRLQYQLADNALLIDRFRLDLMTRTVEFKTQLTANNAPIQLAKITGGWQQFHYYWRYRIAEGGYIYWLYEDVTVNVAFADKFDEAVFLKVEPKAKFSNLLNHDV